MKVFLKIVENYNLAACSKEQANQETKSTKGTNESLEKSFFIVNKLFAKLKQKKAKREVQARKSTR